MTRYTIKFKRKSKEQYWTVKENKTLWQFFMMLDDLLEKTTEDTFMIRIEKEKPK